MVNIEAAKKPIIINVSNRHWHCTQETFEILYGAGLRPTKIRELIQPGQFACKETVTLKGPKSEINKVRLIGPFRPYNQIEISRTDCITLGINAPVRDSGNVKGSAPITLKGPQGEAALKEGAIIQMRHIHFQTKEAEEYGVKNMQIVKIRVGSAPRDGIVSVLCRVRDDMKLECHFDTDEANSFNVKNGDEIVIVPE